MLSALAAAHRAGIVHRDVKPENVLLADDGRVKVADFGLARSQLASGADSSTQGVVMGTVAYLAPEQVERGGADARSDVYAAGIVLFEMLTGAPPFAGDTPMSVAYQHVTTDVPAAVDPGARARAGARRAGPGRHRPRPARTARRRGGVPAAGAQRARRADRRPSCGTRRRTST